MPELNLSSIDELANFLIVIIRAVLGIRIMHSLIVLMTKKPDYSEQIKNRMKNMIKAWIIAETIKQLIPIIQNYFKG